jgi:hypothetical protein
MRFFLKDKVGRAVVKRTASRLLLKSGGNAYLIPRRLAQVAQEQRHHAAEAFWTEVEGEIARRARE